MMNFKGPAKPLEDIDLPRIASRIGCGEDELHAVLDVEAPGGAFDPQGRPRILFEPHIFYRNLHPSHRSVAMAEKLACKIWGQIRYGKESEQYGRLERAMRINETAALKACSWGRPQILGENYVAAGYETVQEMVTAFTISEANQIEAMVRFIKANHLDDDLRAHNWAAFARGYNGPGYRKNAYDVKLAQAYKRWAKIKDTPWSPDEPQAPVIPPAPPLVRVPPPPVSDTAQLQSSGFWAWLSGLFNKPQA